MVIFDTLVDTSYFVPNFNKVEHPIKKILFAGILESKKGVTLLVESIKLCIVDNDPKLDNPRTYVSRYSIIQPIIGLPAYLYKDRLHLFPDQSGLYSLSLEMELFRQKHL